MDDQIQSVGHRVTVDCPVSRLPDWAAGEWPDAAAALAAVVEYYDTVGSVLAGLRDGSLAARFGLLGWSVAVATIRAIGLLEDDEDVPYVFTDDSGSQVAVILPWIAGSPWD